MWTAVAIVIVEWQWIRGAGGRVCELGLPRIVLGYEGGGARSEGVGV